ncbi:MAG: mannose-1-phosphate guanylyltransferase [Candidatus Omnitrophica bacterium]|nr:mannose-1-phosphate guanylyltransferase [Candidatus Omnitrophota bacterium]
MRHLIILAGGKGSRFWPLSQKDKPKQFLNIYSRRSLIEETISRLAGLVDQDNIYIATNKAHKKNINEKLSKKHTRNILFEPQAKNTLAPIGLLSKKILQKDKEAVIMVCPCDHYIKDRRSFLKVMRQAMKVAEKGYLVTLGIIPGRPETGYGYIKARRKEREFYSIDKFIEKPDIKKAREFLKSKKYYWNSGIFIFRADALLAEFKRLNPSNYRLISKIKDESTLYRFWSKLDSLSLDYAIMEKTKNIALIPLSCGWVDLGSWMAIGEIMKKDKNGNVFKGKHLDLKSKNITVWSENKLVVTIGLKDLIVVDAKDAVLICDKSRTQQVREIADRLS